MVQVVQVVQVIIKTTVKVHVPGLSLREVPPAKVVVGPQVVVLVQVTTQIGQFAETLIGQPGAVVLVQVHVVIAMNVQHVKKKV